MIDRPLRPLFPKGWRRETQLVNMPLSVDHDAPYDILAMNGASAALMVSDIPFPQPVGAVRIGKIEGNFVINPGEEAMQEAEMDLVVSGTEEAILMVECGASEVPEAEILDALDIAHGAIKQLVAAQHELREKAGKPKAEVEVPQVDEDLYRADPGVPRRSSSTRPPRSRTSSPARTPPRPSRRRSSRPYSGDPAAPEWSEYLAKAQLAFDKLEKTIIRQRIAVQKKRPDGRGTDEIRDIWIEAGVLPRAHGSAIFTRGQTQALSVASLGTTREEMRVDGLGLETSKRYWHHYNFPPFSVGEAGFMRGPKRRDIGHGALAERALVPMIPSAEEFPYTIRVVSDILESNGSSSMASVCGSSLSLMDAGVPIKRPVAGIAMGLIKEGDDYVVLSDIAGVEDHLGDMDFKVAGTERGITALQMDIKITGVTFDILRDALSQAKEGRTHILGKMAEVIEGPRSELSQFAPRISTIKIDPDKIGLLIGKGGETIRGLCDEFDAQIDVDDDGNVLVYAQTGAAGRRPDRPHPLDDQGGRGRRLVPGQGRQDDHLRRVRRARQGHRRPAAHLQRVAGPARGHGRGRPQQGRRDRRPRGRGRPRARPHRPAPRRGPRDRRQVRRGAGRRRLRRRRRWRRPRPARAAATATAGGGDRGGRGRDRDRGPRPPRGDRDPDRS